MDVTSATSDVWAKHTWRGSQLTFQIKARIGPVSRK